MSDEPLTPLTPKVIVLAFTYRAFAERASQYGLASSNPIFEVVFDYAQAIALTLPVETPWITAGKADYDAWKALTLKYGPASTWAAALKMHNNELAIRPEVLRGQPAKRAPN
jgi:hypothetical protein